MNFMMDEGEGRVQATYRGQLRAAGRNQGKYDPANLFRVNQNIKPAGVKPQPARRAG